MSRNQKKKLKKREEKGRKLMTTSLSGIARTVEDLFDDKENGLDINLLRSIRRMGGLNLLHHCIAIR